MKRATFNISLPPAMAREVETAMRRERRTRSELVREALRVYFRLSAVPSDQEQRSVARGRAEIGAGEYLTLEQLHAELERLDLKERGALRRPRSTARTRTSRPRPR